MKTMPVNSAIRLLSRNDPGTLFTYVSTVFRMFILAVLVVGLLFGVFQWVLSESFNGFIDGMVFGVIFSGITFLILVFLDIIQKFRCYRKYDVFDFEIKQERRFLLEIDYGFVFDKLYEMLLSNKKIEIHKKDMKNGTIEGISKSSLRSFGETIAVTLSKGSQGTVVVISSQPRLRTTTIDYSKNFENLEYIMRDIDDVF